MKPLCVLRLAFASPCLAPVACSDGGAAAMDGPATSAAGSTSGQPTSSQGAGSDAVSATSDLPPACGAEIVAQPELVLDEPLGPVEAFDIDGDGSMDVVGGHGVALRGPKPTVLRAGGGFGYVGGQPCDLDGNHDADMIAASDAGGPLLAILDAFTADPIVRTTDVVETAFFDVADVDGDGLDDLVSLRGQLADAVEVWRGDGTGNFALAGSAAAPWSLGIFALVHTGPDQQVALAFTGGGVGRVELFAPTADALAYLDGYDVADSTKIIGFYPERGAREAILTQAWFTQLAAQSNLTVARRDAGSWTFEYYDLEGAFPADSLAFDGDGDGSTEVAVVSSTPEGDQLDVLCATAGGYDRCAWQRLGIRATGIGALQDPQRIVVTNDEQTWSIELPVPTCDGR